MASTKVDLPEPISPVKRALRPLTLKAHTLLSNVPQL